VLFLFLLPIGLNLVLHWPGEIDDYLRYSLSSQRKPHTLPQGLNYVLQFWTPKGEGGLAVAGALIAAALGLAGAVPAGVLRRFLLGCMAAVAGATVLMWFYAVKGVDALDEAYIGYFYWAAPLVTMLVGVVGAVALAVRTPITRLVAVAASLGVLLAAGRGHGLVNDEMGDGHIAPAVRAMTAARASADQPLVISFDHAAWPDVVGVVVNADRHHVRACVADPAWKFMFTEDFVCRRSELSRGVRFDFKALGSTQGPAVAIMSRSVVQPG
jgi:hypothetical protein